jgi:hypothetical protein
MASPDESVDMERFMETIGRPTAQCMNPLIERGLDLLKSGDTVALDYLLKCVFQWLAMTGKLSGLISDKDESRVLQ